MFNLRKLREWAEKSKIGITPLILLLLGFGFLLLPNIFSGIFGGGENIEKNTDNNFEFLSWEDSYLENMEKRLREILSQIEGVGRVDILITMESYGETVYAKDVRKSGDSSKTDITEQTVIIQGPDRSEQALIERELYPGIRGAVIVCDGADNPVTAAKIIETVKAVLGIPANKICVAKKE